MPPLEEPGENLDNAASPAADAASTPAPVDSNSDAPVVTPDPQSSSGTDTPAEAVTPEPKSMAEAIEQAMKVGTEKPLADDDDKSKDGEEGGKDAKDADPDRSKEPSNDGSDDTELADPTEEELAALKPKHAKRVKQLLNQRNAARREVDTLKVDAGSFRQIRQFMDANNLADKEVAELFTIGADLKSGDPERLAKFLERVMPTVQGVLEATGRSVPRDLRKQVETGEMTEEAAKAFGLERHKRHNAEDRASRATEHVAARDTAARADNVRTAVATWEQQVRATDPDFDLKAKAMSRAAKALVAERGLPKTPEDAVAFSKEAYEAVNADFALARPAPRQTRTTPAGPSANPTGKTPAPTSLEDVIRGALGGSARP